MDRARGILGAEAVAAIATITGDALDRPDEVVDAYVDLGFRSVFLRPVAPYGFARRQPGLAPSVTGFIEFYRRALDRCIEHCRAGRHIEEAYAAILLTHILTPFGGGCGFGIGLFCGDSGLLFFRFL